MIVDAYNKPIVIEPPDGEWVTRLRTDDFVFAPKEDRFLSVSFAYEAPLLPDHGAGRIGLRYLWWRDGHWGSEFDIHQWFIKPTGLGFDGVPILKPCAGYLADDPPPLSDPWRRSVERSLTALRARLDQLEARDQIYFNPFDPPEEGFDL